MTRADQIFESFVRFHKENPRVWRLFEQLSFGMLYEGHLSYSANAIFEQIRLHMSVTTTGAEVKLSNNHRAYYARLFHVRHPHLYGFFKCRRLVSDDVEEYVHEPEIDFTPASKEERITQRIKELLT
jgi:hypothetical protein